MLDAINLAILIGAGLVSVSAITSLISQRLGAPLLLIFLAIGLLAGEDGLLSINFDSAGTAYFIGSWPSRLSSSTAGSQRRCTAIASPPLRR